MLYALKGRFQNFAQKWAHRGMTANHATFLGAAFVALTALSLFEGFKQEPKSLWLLFTPFFILVRLIMNALDGLLSRAHKTASASGEIMNEVSDVVGDTVSYGVLYFVFPLAHLEITLFLLAIWFCEFVGVLGKSLPGGRRRQEALCGGKPERALWMCLFAVTGFFYGPPSWVNGYFIFLSVLVFITALFRIHKSIVDARGKPYVSQTEFGR